MKQGDFSTLAKSYINRPGYSETVLYALLAYIQSMQGQEGFSVADVGAGTGKLTENLLNLGLQNITAVEPNENMREEGALLTQGKEVRWLEGSGESTTLEDSSVDWLLMASSFHWTKPELSLPEFRRVLKPGGYLTVLWNPRDIENNVMQKEIDQMIFEMLPNLKRVSSGSSKFTENIDQTLVSTGDFSNVLFVEGVENVPMTKERYMGAWKSVNDIQAQAGPEGFQEILDAIETKISHLTEVMMTYKTRSWTARSNG